jgi:hypothetical protein
MEENTNMSGVVEEIKNASEEDLRKVIEKWFEQTRTSGMKIGAQYISAAIFGVIKKHLKKTSAPSLRDYKRCVDEIAGIISVQLTQQNDSEEENKNDRTTE